MAEDPNRSDALADGFAQWTEGWRKIAEFSSEMNEAWSKSMLPFIMARAAEKRTGLGNELGDAIERLAQGPRLADMWDIDRKLMSAFAAWTAMRQKLAAYNANTSRPWMRALERYKTAFADKQDQSASWREDFSAWSSIANEEMIRNQRSEEFLQAQRELLQAGIEFRKTQTELSETTAALFGLPTLRDFDDITRQVTELRRELRALARSTSAAPAAEQKPSVSPARRPRRSAPRKGAADE